MQKFYLVKQDNFLWEKGAILVNTATSSGGYEPLNPVWIKHESHPNEYISASIVENEPQWFERVYKVDLVTRVVYKTKEEAKKLLARGFKK